MRPRHFLRLGIFVRERFLDQPLLGAVREAIAEDEGEPTEVISDRLAGPAVSQEIRRAWEVSLPDALEAQVLDQIEGLRPSLEAWCGQALSPCQALAALRYPEGAFYRTHRDASPQPDALGLHRRVVSVVVFVNGAGRAFSGGALRLYDLDETGGDGLDVTPEAGTLVAFPSALLHEVTVVERGERQSLVAWLMAADSGDGRS
jgi:predicted 2-oxoglutarate/Fe(II)-dependent dioxygenase YbiX